MHVFSIVGAIKYIIIIVYYNTGVVSPRCVIMSSCARGSGDGGGSEVRGGQGRKHQRLHRIKHLMNARARGVSFEKKTSSYVSVYISDAGRRYCGWAWATVRILLCRPFLTYSQQSYISVDTQSNDLLNAMFSFDWDAIFSSATNDDGKFTVIYYDEYHHRKVVGWFLCWRQNNDPQPDNEPGLKWIACAAHDSALLLNDI